MTIPTGAMERLLKPYEAAKFLRLSLSWLAKRRPTGVFIRLGRSSIQRDRTSAVDEVSSGVVVEATIASPLQATFDECQTTYLPIHDRTSQYINRNQHN
jgi:hypothetical protein